jgi:ribosomal protein S18 acetylase RimI-like enzyme
MTKPSIKPTTKEDIPALQIVAAQTVFPGELLPEMIAAALAGESEAIWLTCHLDGSAVGFCYTVPEQMADRTWNMLALAVQPDLQGKGFGTAMIEAVEYQLRNSNQRILIVDTSGTDDFALTRKFYALNGYEEEARIRDFWAPGDDKVTFRKAL